MRGVLSEGERYKWIPPNPQTPSPLTLPPRRFSTRSRCSTSTATPDLRMRRWDVSRKEHGYNEVAETKGHPVLRFLGKFWGISAWMLELIMMLSAVLRKFSDLAVVSALLVRQRRAEVFNRKSTGPPVSLKPCGNACRSVCVSGASQLGRSFQHGNWFPLCSSRLSTELRGALAISFKSSTSWTVWRSNSFLAGKAWRRGMLWVGFRDNHFRDCGIGTLACGGAASEEAVCAGHD